MVSRIARADETGATLPGSDSAQTACRPSWLAAVKSTPVDVTKMQEIVHACRMSGHKLIRKGAMELKALEKITWEFVGEEALESVLFRLVRDRLRGEIRS